MEMGRVGEWMVILKSAPLEGDNGDNVENRKCFVNHLVVW